MRRFAFDTKTSASSSPRRRRDGSYAMLLVISLPVLLGVGAIAVDLSYQKVVRTEIQAAADIAALAATAELDGTDEGIERARATAIRAAARNTAGGESVQLKSEWLRFGHWDSQSGQFIESSDPEEVDSVSVWLNKGQVSAAFASVAFDDPYTEVTGASVGLDPLDVPPGALSCHLPLGIPKCVFDQYTDDEVNSLVLVLNPSGVDNVGWARLGDSPNANWIKQQLYDCTYSGEVRVDDMVGLQNGEVVSALKEVDDAIAVSDTRWLPEWGEMPVQMDGSTVKSADWGKTLEGPIIVFDGGDDYCVGSGGNFTGYEPVVGFVWGAIFDVRSQGAAASKNIHVHLDTTIERQFGTRPGGTLDAGIVYDTPPQIAR